MQVVLAVLSGKKNTTKWIISHCIDFFVCILTTNPLKIAKENLVFMVLLFSVHTSVYLWSRNLFVAYFIFICFLFSKFWYLELNFSRFGLFAF